MTDAPERHIVITLRLGADDIREAIAAFNHIAFWLREIESDLEAGSLEHHSVSGGVGSGHVIDVKVNPEVTNSTYHAALMQYLEERKAEPAEDG